MSPSITIATTGPKEQNQQNGNHKKTIGINPTSTVPPDGGWGWVVVVASFCSNAIVDGFVTSAGMFKEPIEAEFKASASATSLVFSLLSGFYLIAGPFASALANRYGFRPIALIGAIIAFFAFVISSFANRVVYLYTIYGVIGGIGLGMIYIPSVIIVGYYFERWRALATGIAMCGSGVGTSLFSIFNTAMIKWVGWRSTLLVESFIILACALTSSLYRPLKSIEVTVQDEQEEQKIMLPAVFTKPLTEGRNATSLPNSVHNTWIGAGNNTQHPTAVEVFRGMDVIVKQPQLRNITDELNVLADSFKRIPVTLPDIEEEEQDRCDILDLTLLKSPSFMLLALSGFLTMMGFYVPFMFMKDRAAQVMDQETAAFTVAAIGISNTLARIFCGLLSSFKGVNALYLNNICITIGGLATIFSGLYLTEEYQFTYATIFGVAIACFSTLRTLIAVDLVGLEKLTNAFGLLMLFQGLAAVMGGPIAGLLYDATKSYDSAFYFSGALITLSAILCYPLNVVNKWEKTRAEKSPDTLAV